MSRIFFALARNIVCLATLLFVTGIAAAQPAPAQGGAKPGDGFNGTWQGVLRSGGLDEQTGAWRWGDDPIGLRLVVQGGGVNVYLGSGESWRPVDMQFRWESRGVSAVITAFKELGDLEGRWIETWTLSATQVDWRTLEVTLTRQVNNEYDDRDEPDAVFWQFGYGTFELQDPAR
jgi:hypothetical protein